MDSCRCRTAYPAHQYQAARRRPHLHAPLHSLRLRTHYCLHTDALNHALHRSVSCHSSTSGLLQRSTTVMQAYITTARTYSQRLPVHRDSRQKKFSPQLLARLASLQRPSSISSSEPGTSLYCTPQPPCIVWNTYVMPTRGNPPLHVKVTMHTTQWAG